MAAKKNSKNSYILIHCRVCDDDFKIYKKDNDGNFLPQAVCLHTAYKGIRTD